MSVLLTRLFGEVKDKKLSAKLALQAIKNLHENVTGGELLLSAQRWTALSTTESPGDAAAIRQVSPERRFIVLDASLLDLKESIQAHYPGVRVEVLQHASNAAGQDWDALLEIWRQVFVIVLSALSQKGSGASLMQLVLNKHGESSDSIAAIGGMLKTAEIENPKLRTQVITIDGSTNGVQLAETIERDAEVAWYGDQELRHTTGHAEVLRLEELSVNDAPEDDRAPTYPWKDRGVYWITGGAGKLGLILAKEIASNVEAPTIVLIGRSQVNSTIAQSVAEVRALGANVEYRELDITDAAAVAAALADNTERHGALNGLIHCAGVIRDNYLIKKNWDDCQAVFAPKVRGTLLLDSTLQEQPLDFFILFSSLSGVLGNAGQGDYACANAFMDRFSAYRSALVLKGLRHGRTLSISWPLWKEGGMQVDDATFDLMAGEGISALSTEEGIEVLYRAYRSDAPHVAVLCGERSRLQTFLQRPRRGESAPSAEASRLLTGNHVQEFTQDVRTAIRLKEQVLRRLKSLLSVETKLDVERIDGAEALESYGIDSMMIVRMNAALTEAYHDLPKTIFYEYPSLNELSEYLTDEHRVGSELWTGVSTRAKSTSDETAIGRVHAQVKVVPERIDQAITAPAAGRSDLERVAIVGLSGQYPGARSVAEFWEILKDAKNCIREIPVDRWSLSGFYEPDVERAIAEGKSYCKWGGFLDGFAEFDPLFFNISPREAECMDPQERLFLQECWRALEDAGYTRDILARRFGGRVGVYAGITKTGFELYGPALRRRGESLYPHTSFSSVANRVSYLLNLHGPSMPIDTMCSASLTAIHEACEHLRRGECELAIAGGINLYAHPSSYSGLCAQRMLSPDGLCKSFGAGGNGFVPGEGVGVVVLKLLDRAIADNDHIHGVIRGTSINHGGKTNGYTVPNPHSQSALIAGALRKAKIDARTISYIEAHGTGTELGDPIEVAGLTQAFAEQTNDSGFCALGSVKTNIGHLEAASGIAGLTKVLLQFKHGMLVPSLHADSLNPHIDFSRTPFNVQRQAVEWKRPIIESGGVAREHPRIAGISSFGAGGSNAHVIVEEYREDVSRARAPRDGSRLQASALFVLSAKSAEQLRVYARQLGEHLAAVEDELDLYDIAYTLQIGREPMEWRLAFVATSLEGAKQGLSAHAAGVVNASPHSELIVGQINSDKSLLATFSSDDDLRATLAVWARKGKFDQLLRLWVRGVGIDWESLYCTDAPLASSQVRRVSLPVYPFARERYWFDLSPPDDAQSPIESRSNAAGVPRNAPRFADTVVAGQHVGVTPADLQHRAVAVERCVFIENWQELPLNAPSVDASQLTVVAILSDDQNDRSELFAAAARKIQQTRHKLILATEATFEDALSAVTSAGSGVDAFWFLPGLDGARTAHESHRIGAVLQRLHRAGIVKPKLVVSAEFCGPLERCYVESWIGFERSIGCVLPSAQVAVIHEERSTSSSSNDECGSASLIPPSGGTDETRIEKWLARLWRETLAQSLESAWYVGEQRHVLRVSLTALDDTAPDSRLRIGGVYWITGGLGAIGMTLARHLARRYSAKLILTGRSVAGESARAALEELRIAGAEAIYVEADVRSDEQASAAVQCALDHFGVLHGVIHAAGVAGTGSVLTNELSDSETISSAKVQGTSVIDRVLQRHGVLDGLDFICHCSSLSAVLGDFGVCDYAVGNRFQLAHAKYAQPKAFAVCWPVWAGLGMGADNDANRLYLSASGQVGLFAADAMDIFERLQARHAISGMDHAIVMLGERRRLVALMNRTTHTREYETEDSRVRRQKRSELIGFSIPQRVVLEVKEEVSALLKVPVERIVAEENLAEYGFDSILLAGFSRRLSERFGVEVLPSVFFSHASVAKVAEYLVTRQGAALAELYGGAAREAEEAREEQEQGTREVRMKAAASEDVAEGIAIIGMSGRFAGARSVEGLWEVLSSGRNAVQEIPLSRFDWREYYAPGEGGSGGSGSGKTNSKWMGLVDGVEEFDASFFEISPKEAQLMDPRQRLLLEETFKALEDAGYGERQLKQSKVGVYVGVEQGDYQVLVGEQGLSSSVTGNHDAILAARLSYFLDLRGPAMAINTACSSGLVALHQACLSVRSGECDTALAAGVNLILTPQMYVGMSQAGMLSGEGKCYAFDRRANGMVPGEAVVAVVLKRLSQAEAEGDSIYGVIRGSGINYDGKTNGLTAPSGAAQAALIEAVYAQAQVAAREIEYIVTHGTGTRLGDPVEINALREAFKGAERGEPYCALTSTKTNVGHTFAASGLVSVVALVQAMRHETIPASLHCEELSEYIDWRRSPFYVNRENRAWPTRAQGRLGAVSAFGMSGTNAHVVVESYEAKSAQATEEDARAPSYVLAVSGKSEAALKRRIEDLIGVLQEEAQRWGGVGLARMSHTLLNHRQHFGYRCAVVVADREHALGLLKKALTQEPHVHIQRGRVAREMSEQPALKSYAGELLGKLTALHDQPDRHRESLCALADLYCQGYALQWQRLFAKSLRPVRLPTYPFAPDRCWVTMSKHADKRTVNNDSVPSTQLDPNSADIDRSPRIRIDKPSGIKLSALSDRALPKPERPDQIQIAAGAPGKSNKNSGQVMTGSRSDAQEATRDRLTSELIESLARALYLDRDDIHIDVPFTELGLDSVIGVEWAHELSRNYAVTLSATRIYDYPNIKALTNFLMAEIETKPPSNDAKLTLSIPATRQVDREQPEVVRVLLKNERVADAALDTGGQDRQPNSTPVDAGAIAVIGVSGAFPKARNLDEFWQRIVDSENCVSEIPPERMNLREYFGTDGKALGKTYNRWMGVLDDADKFDPQFFGLSPAEAVRIDPQQRLFLEHCWTSIENAGINPRTLSESRCAVFVGCSPSDYSQQFGEAALAAQFLVGNASSILAARISYVLNLKGPSIAVDTACSSSLVAIAQACDNLVLGRSDIALAGGVSISVGPVLHVTGSNAGMLSPTGRCYAFDSRADGFVPAEGVGVVLLKRLSDAVRDRDNIQCVIRGWGVNQDGKTNGITAPSAISQTRLETEVYEKYGIDPRTITLVEAHGTGTRLGDPIEIRALTEAFRAHTNEKRFCAIGSVKSNIGHTLAAAGVASLLKTILAMRHRKLPPTINFATPNDHVEWNDSPFFVNDTLRSWDVSELPRRAAVSSFGFSGTNAHLVLEEYCAGRPDSPTETDKVSLDDVVVPISARRKAQLRDYVVRVRDFIADHQDLSLRDLSYTMQTARDDLEFRIAIVANGRDSLLAACDTYLQEGTSENIFSNESGGKSRSTSALDRGDGRELLSAWLSKRRLRKLAEVWAHGATIDWSRLYDESAPVRIAAPTYPFARERYWIRPADDGKRVNFGKGDFVDALLLRNTSDFGVQRFSTTLTVDNYLVAGHIVLDQRLLPAAAHLSIATVASLTSFGERLDGRVAVELRNVTWLRPVAVAEKLELHVRLRPTASRTAVFDIYSTNAVRAERDSRSNNVGPQEMLHSSGTCGLVDAARVQHDLRSLRSKCELIVGANECYEALESTGIRYSLEYRGLQDVAVAQANGRPPYALARIQMPHQLDETFDSYLLHPCILDCALQATVALTCAARRQAPLQSSFAGLPFSIDEVIVEGRCERTSFAYIRPASQRVGNTEVKLDIDVCNEQGIALIRIRGLATRPADKNGRRPVEHAQYPASSLVGRRADANVSLFSRSWVRAEEIDAPASSASSDQCEPTPPDHWILLHPHFESSIPVLRQHSGAQIRLLNFSQQGSYADFLQSVRQVLDLLRRLISHQSRQPSLLQIVIPHIHGEEDDVRGDWCLAALSGVLRSAMLENGRFSGQVLSISREVDEAACVAPIRQSAAYALRRQVELRHRNGVFERIDLTPVPSSQRSGPTEYATHTKSPWKRDGVYLITGGAGGLARIFVREITRATESATVILCGRSSIEGAVSDQIRQVSGGGVVIDYQIVDVADALQVEACVNGIVDRYGRLDGVIHSAGVTRDEYVLQKDLRDVERVFAPKIAGALNLDRATQNLQLDFLVLFSSLSGAFGSVGQSDYACANAFLDRFAEYRSTRVRAGERHGRTLSINWPLWRDGGMRVDPATLDRMNREGFSELSAEQGLASFYAAYNSDFDQVVVLCGDQSLLHERVRAGFAVRPILESAESTTADTPTELQTRVEATLVQIVARHLEIDVEEIDPHIEFGEFGLDSIGLVSFCNILNARADLQLSPTVFFEYNSITALSEYLRTEYGEHLKTSFLKPDPASNSDTAPSSRLGRFDPQSSLPGARFVVEQAERGQLSTDLKREPIAVIGMSGCFPGAKDLDRFWENLAAGRDSIVEIPSSRWNWRDYYGEPGDEGNTTDVKWGGFIDGVDLFDSQFFNISPKDAVLMDPQQRLLLTHAWKAIEDAGYAPSSLSGSRTGVFVGTAGTGYEQLVAQADLQIDGSSSTGMVASLGPNRVSYFLNLHGPSEPIETACSSSIVAIHRAVRAIQCGDCDAALVGGVNTIVTPWGHISFRKAGMLSPDGRCKAFSAAADGYVRGEGVGILFLKKLSAARRDGDHIYALIAGSGENHGGRANSLTAPNLRAQSELIKAAYREAKIDPRTVTYIEAHGTGTALGDPIEVDALKAAFSALAAESETSGDQAIARCGLGSVKSNIGHLELAAGVAGVMKVLLQLKHKTLAKSLHCEAINPLVDLRGTQFFIVGETQPWLSTRQAGRQLPRRAGVSSFGFGGVNGHVILEEFSDDHEIELQSGRAASRYPAIIVLSAKQRELLTVQAELLLRAILEKPLENDSLYDIAYTLQVGRDAMEWRMAIPVKSTQELIDALRRFLNQSGEDTLGGIRIAQVRKGKDSAGSTVESNACKEGIQQLLNGNDCERLMAEWLSGGSVDWQRLYQQGSIYGATNARRLSLPTYPFAQKRYWITEVDKQIKASGAGGTIRSQKAADANAADSIPRRPASRKVSLSNLEAREAPLSLEVPLFANGKVNGVNASEEAAAHSHGSHFADFAYIDCDDLLRRLTEGLSQQLLIDFRDVDVKASLFEMGMDSVAAVQWARKLTRAYGVPITAARIYELQTLNALAAFIANAKGNGEIPDKTIDPSTVDSAAYSSSLPKVSVEIAEGIAIIGMTGAYAGSSSVEELWDNLQAARDCIQEIPKGRWDVDSFYEPDAESATIAGKSYCKWGGFSPLTWKCDREFFSAYGSDVDGRSEAELLIIQSVWELLEKSGYTAKELNALCDQSIGVFIGARPDAVEGAYPFAIAAGVASFYGFRGPVLAVDTMSSSAMTALHLACESLANGGCTAAIVAGVSKLERESFVRMSAIKILGDSSETRTFGNSRGMLPSEGLGAVLLKRSGVAKSHHDNTLAIVRSTSVANSGSRGESLQAKQRLIEDNLSKGNVDARTITYVEAAAAGDMIVDALEVQALTNAFEKHNAALGSCAIGSVKANIGHALGVSGLSQLTKVVLQLQHREIAPFFRVGSSNEDIRFAESPFYIPEHLSPWRGSVTPDAGSLSTTPLRAMINSYGGGGAMVNIIVEEAREDRSTVGEAGTRPGGDPCVVPVSARSGQSLRAYLKKISAFLKSKNDLDLVSVAQTFQYGRESMTARVVLVAQSCGELSDLIDDVLHGHMEENHSGRLGQIWYTASCRPSSDSTADVLIAAEHWVTNAESNWRPLDHGQLPARRLELPSYPFDTKAKCGVEFTGKNAGKV